MLRAPRYGRSLQGAVIFTIRPKSCARCSWERGHPARNGPKAHHRPRGQDACALGYALLASRSQAQPRQNLLQASRLGQREHRVLQRRDGGIGQHASGQALVLLDDLLDGSAGCASPRGRSAGDPRSGGRRPASPPRPARNRRHGGGSWDMTTRDMVVRTSGSSMHRFSNSSRPARPVTSATPTP